MKNILGKNNFIHLTNKPTITISLKQKMLFYLVLATNFHRKTIKILRKK